MKNTLNFGEYFLSSLYYLIVLFINFRIIGYSNLHDMTALQSHLVLLLIIVVTFVINLVISVKWSRNTINAILMSVIPFAIYIALINYRYMPDFYNKIGIVAFTLFIMLTFFITGSEFYVLKKLDAKKRKKSFVRFLNLEVNCLRRIIGIAMLVSVIGLVGRYCLSDGLIPVSKQPAKENAITAMENSMDENMDSMVKLLPENWKTLSNEEKMDVLQILVNIESRFLGLDKPVHITARRLEEGLNGFYEDSKGLIVINVDLLAKNPDKVVKTVTHEGRHASQYTLVRIYDQLDEAQQKSIYMYNASIYKDEFKNYQDGDEDFFRYYAQRCEADARWYSEGATEDIYDRIEEYLKKEK